MPNRGIFQIIKDLIQKLILEKTKRHLDQFMSPDSKKLKLNLNTEIQSTQIPTVDCF